MPTLQDLSSGAIETAVRSASRRRMFVLAAEQLALALALICGGAILMLLLGTQILHWYWLVLLGAVGVTVAVSRLRRRTLPRYRVAQLLDERLHLSDSLSTAWHLLSTPARQGDSVADLQIGRARQLLPSLRIADAFPFAGQRAWAVTVALAVVAFGLFAVRYLVTSSLSLRSSLIPVQLSSVFEATPSGEAPVRAANLHALKGDGRASLDSPSIPEVGSPKNLPEPQDSNGNSPDGATNASSANQGSTPQDGKSGRSEGQDKGTADAKAQSGDAEKQPGKQEAASQKNAAGKQPSAGGQDSSPGLMDKMKDALSSLMAKMRPAESTPKTAENNQPANDGKKNGSETSGSKDQAAGQKNAANQASSQDPSSEGQAQGQTTEKAQASQSSSSDQSPNEGSDAHSGVGRQDGAKDVHETDGLKAMGKLAEIIGKRSADLTGEMTIETPSSKQQLKTAYSQRLGHHSDSGGEINRDEVPLDQQQYVREYMEQVRKQPKSAQ